MANKFREEALERVGATARKWSLYRLIDVGGMAAVYEAVHRNGNRVALKVMHRQYAAMPEAKERFLREGYVANKVRHVNAVTVIDDDELDDGTPYLVMELLEGHPLEAYMGNEQRIMPAQILFVAAQVLDVLGAAHHNGIIHRDIKPGNIFITGDGTAKVLDFGLARVMTSDNMFSPTRPGLVLGTASYMSPEQARGKRDNIDHQTDLYAVGAVIFRGLTGRTPHMADRPMDRLIKVMKEPAPSLAEFRPNAPADLVAFVDEALAFDKADRFKTASAMQEALRVVYQANTGTPLPSVHDFAMATTKPQASGAGGNATTSSQGMTIGVTSTTTSGGNSLCDPACTSLTACSNTDGCIQGCESQQGPCGELHQNWMSCSLGETNTMCGFGPGTICLPELGEYVNCQGMLELGPCQGGPNGDCQCFAVINGGESFLDQFCEPGQGCLCLRDGEVIGECEPGQEICGIVDGCCAGVFFTQGI